MKTITIELTEDQLRALLALPLKELANHHYEPVQAIDALELALARHTSLPLLHVEPADIEPPTMRLLDINRRCGRHGYARSSEGFMSW